MPIASFQKSALVAVFVRIANAQANPTSFLFDLLQGNFTATTSSDATVLVSTTTGGSSANWTLPPGTSRFDISEIAELALRNIETGIDAPVTTNPDGSQVAPTIKQTLPSQRVISYGQFGNIRR